MHERMVGLSKLMGSFYYVYFTANEAKLVDNLGEASVVQLTWSRHTRITKLHRRTTLLVSAAPKSNFIYSA